MAYEFTMLANYYLKVSVSNNDKMRIDFDMEREDREDLLQQLLKAQEEDRKWDEHYAKLK